MQRVHFPYLLASLSLALWLALAASVGHAAEPAPRTVPDTMAQRMMACTLCHGAQGRATSSGYFPRIAGKPVD
ncbi:MAG: cytochrome C, partial [Comamonadaceae bacterium]|nr:cytochrome C [Comamonadaceae bacterium]